MSDGFDPYHVWLGIPPEERPLNRYRLLGIPLFEPKPEVIDNAADRQTAHLRTLQTGQHVKLAERLLNEIAAARVCLLDPQTKAAYDRKLRAMLPGAAPQAAADSTAADSAAARRKISRRAKLLAGGIALIAAAVVGIAAFALSRPKEAVLTFDWPAADRAGATLTVDQQPVEIPANGPWEFHGAAGQHQIVAKRPAFKLESTVTVAAGEHQLIPAEWKPKAVLVLNWPLAERSGAALAIDGLPQPASQREPWEFPVEPGQHVIHVTRPDSPPVDIHVPVASDERLKVNVNLPLWPKLVLDWPVEQRQDATLTIDDQPVAVDSSAATIESSLKPGPHTIHITRPGFEPFEQVANLDGGATSISPVWKPLATAPGIAGSDPVASHNDLASPDKPDKALSNINPINPDKPASGTAVAESGAPAKKLAPPAPAEQERIAKELDEIYKVSHSPAKDKALVAEMFKAADGPGTSPAERYMLLKKGTILAAEVGDFEKAFQGVDSLETTYGIDAFVVKQKLLNESLKSLTAADQVDSLIAAAEQLLAQAIATDQYDAALAIVTTAKEAIARRPADLQHFKDADEQLARRRREIVALQASQSVMQEARKTLATDPTNADANLALGRWYCFLKGDWASGLPLLAKGSDPGLKSPATQELAGNLDAKQQLQLADAWWDLAGKQDPLTKRTLQERAGYWYEQAAPGLEGLGKAKAENRIAELRPAGQDPKGTPSYRKKHWLVIFHSADPSIWNTNTSDARGFAVTLDKVPADIKYLKIQIDANRLVIMDMKREQIGGTFHTGDFGWTGINNIEWGGRQLGIFDLANPKNAAGEVIMTYIDAQTGGRSGCGFGYRAQANNQGYAWRGKPIGRTVFDFAVSSDNLGVTESKSRLK